MTAFQVVVLWTDWLVYLLLAAVVAGAVHVRRREHLRASWRRVAGSPGGMAAFVVLACFVVVGLLDSVHYRPRIDGSGKDGKAVYAVQVLSVLDLALDSLRSRREKTYSAPLATHLYARETMDLGNGRQAREFPRLVHGGSHLADPAAERMPDILARTARGVLVAALAWGVIATGIAARQGRSRGGFRAGWRIVWRGESHVPWRSILVALGLLLAVAGVVTSLAGGYHVLGTDKVGQDVLYQSLKSIRTALVIGTLTTLVMLPFAIGLGVAAGYFGGLIDDVIQYVYTTLNSIPSVLLIAAGVLMMQVYIDTHPDLFQTAAERADFRLLFLCIVLGVTEWTGLCRLLRGETLKLRQLEYVEAARAFGVHPVVILARHVVPNVMHLVLITVVLGFSGLVLAEAVLSYVGVGVDPSMNSFGTMINNARLEMARDPMVWWSLASAFVFMLVLVLSANVFADAVRDALDPRVVVGRRRGVRRGEVADAHG